MKYLKSVPGKVVIAGYLSRCMTSMPHSTYSCRKDTREHIAEDIHLTQSPVKAINVS